MTGQPTYIEQEQRVNESGQEAAARKRAENAAPESDEKFKVTTALTQDAIIIMDHAGNISYWNGEAKKILGYSAQEVLGKELQMLLAPRKYDDASEREILACKRTGRAHVDGKTLELEGVRKDGTTFPMELSVSPVKIEGKWHSVGIVRDISLRKEVEKALQNAHDLLEQGVQERTAELARIHKLLKLELAERKRAEQAMRQSERRYRTLFEDSRDAIYITSREGRFLDVNQSTLDLFGYTREEMIGMDVLKTYVNPDDRYRFQQHIEQSGSLRDYEVKLCRKDGTQVDCVLTTTVRRADNGTILGYAGIVRDVTDQKRLQTTLQQAQKMEAVGTLAAGIAHDFNNVLGAVIGYTEIAQMHVAEGSPAKAKLDEVLKAANRAKDLVNQILTFSRQSEQEPKALQLSLIVKEALKWLRASLPATIEIRQNINKDSGVVLADPTQVHQVLMNLCTNAAHAMRDNGGVLEVSVEDMDLDPISAAQHPDMKPGRYVRLTVADTGHGMVPEVMARIFDPYFTTKEKGVGTGLGLSVVHGIVQNYGGAIIVYSQPGEGTTFHVLLPRIDIKAAKETEPTRLVATGSERVLFVDDEEALASIGQEVLEYLGYRVVTKTRSIEALEVFRSQPDAFDLVITDQTMPGMTGDILAKELLRIRPDIPIILCTGYSELIGKHKAKAMGIREFLMKPISIHHVAETIRKVLDKHGR